MKKFLIHICIFAIIMVLCDIVIGVVGDYLIKRTKDGVFYKKEYISNYMNDDVVIFGTSRAYRHYSPNILEDSLGMSVYNCGLSNNGIIGARGLYKMIEKRYHPKLIIYDIMPGSDLLARDNHMDLGDLRHYYDREGIDSIFWDVDPSERYKMVSQMYRLNSILPLLLLDCISPQDRFEKGAIMTNKVMNSEPKPLGKSNVYTYDSLKLRYLEELINDCRGKTQLIFTVSPLYWETDDKVLAPVESLCEKYDIPLISHYTDSSFHHRRDIFYDGIHLNRKGATKYGEEVAGEVKKILEGRCDKEIF